MSDSPLPRRLAVVALHLLLALMVVATATGAGHAQPPAATVFVTAQKTGDRLADKGRVPFQSVAQPEENAITIFVDPSRAFQTIEGIGGALTDASAETFFKLPAAAQAEFITACYDRQKGIGYNWGRTHINSCDFSSASYAYAPPGDTTLSRFSIAPDLRYRVPFIRRVLAVVPDLKLFASPWSPPAWMKTNNDMLRGGKLKPEYFSAWARYYVRFIQEYARQGIPIWGLTVQNEPMAVQTWESCIYTADDERDFVKKHLGPALHASGMKDVRLMVWDHNRNLLYQRARGVLSDPEAAKYVWGTAYHWYVGDHFENVALVHEAWPDKKLVFSEGCNGPFDPKALDDWKLGETYGRSMIKDFNNHAVAWTDWNVLLDERGGPNHVGNYCFAPIIGDTRTGKLHYTSAYYYIGHFSKFVRPGARRLACSSTSDDILATAFRNPDGRFVAVVMNPTDRPCDFQIWVDGQAAPTKVPAHAIATLTW